MGQLIPENAKRKLDTLGRLTLPKGLRDRMFLRNEIDELEIFTAVIDGRNCICLAKQEDEKDKLRAAVKVLAEAGVELTAEQMEQIDE